MPRRKPDPSQAGLFEPINLSARQRDVLAAIARKPGHTPIKSIARIAGVSSRTAIRAVAELLTLGLIERESPTERFLCGSIRVTRDGMAYVPATMTRTPYEIGS